WGGGGASGGPRGGAGGASGGSGARLTPSDSITIRTDACACAKVIGSKRVGLSSYFVRLRSSLSRRRRLSNPAGTTPSWRSRTLARARASCHPSDSCAISTLSRSASSSTRSSAAACSASTARSRKPASARLWASANRDAACSERGAEIDMVDGGGYEARAFGARTHLWSVACRSKRYGAAHRPRAHRFPGAGGLRDPPAAPRGRADLPRTPLGLHPRADQAPAERRAPRRRSRALRRRRIDPPGRAAPARSALPPGERVLDGPGQRLDVVEAASGLRGCDVGPGEVGALEKQRPVRHRRERVGEAVAEGEPGGSASLPEPCERVPRHVRLRAVDRHAAHRGSREQLVQVGDAVS